MSSRTRLSVRLAARFLVVVAQNALPSSSFPIAIYNSRFSRFPPDTDGIVKSRGYYFATGPQNTNCNPFQPFGHLPEPNTTLNYARKISICCIYNYNDFQISR